METTEVFKFRTAEDVLELAEQAKLNPDELCSYTQCLEFASDLLEESSDLRLLELNSDLLSELCEGSSLIIRGDDNDAAVLCTDNKTYEVRGAETSNSMLILSDLSLPGSFPSSTTHTVQPVKVLSTQYKYIELKQSQPKLQKLLLLLEEYPYNGEDLLEEKCYTIGDLLNRVQGSEEEILEKLKYIMAYKINGFWTILDFDYHFRVLSSILNHIEIKCWPLNAIPKNACIQSLRESESETILDQCFGHFFRYSGEKTDEDDLLYQIIEDAVCKFCAEVLLKPAGKFHLEEFLSIWQQSVPEGLCTNLGQLEGVALVDRGCLPPIISHYPASKLPENLAERFAVLFDTKDKWTLQEIRSYLAEYSSERTPISALLTKHSRASQQDGVKYFSRRHPK